MSDGVFKTVVEVEISNIYVDETMFSFDYDLKRNGKLVDHSKYSDKHNWKKDLPEFKKLIRERYAADLIIRRVYGKD